MTENDNQRALRVLQLTDPHLMADPAGGLLGVNTRDSLDAVIAQVFRDHGQPDLILATGDIAQDASEEAYRLFGDKLEVFQCDTAWMAGNHDDSPLLSRIAAERGANQRHIIQGGWQFVLLDTSVPGKVFGELSEPELAFLEKTLSENPDLPALVALHHHPVEIDWGHIHQELDQTRKSARLLATPSTCIQFTAGSVEFSVEDKAPGYRWFELLPSGEFSTEVSRATDFVFELDSNSTGY